LVVVYIYKSRISYTLTEMSCYTSEALHSSRVHFSYPRTVSPTLELLCISDMTLFEWIGRIDPSQWCTRACSYDFIL